MQIAQITTKHLEKHYSYTQQIKIEHYGPSWFTANPAIPSMLHSTTITITKITGDKHGYKLATLHYGPNKITHHQHPHIKIPLEEFLQQTTQFTIPYANPNYFTELTNYTDQLLRNYLNTHQTTKPQCEKTKSTKSPKQQPNTSNTTTKTPHK